MSTTPELWPEAHPNNTVQIVTKEQYERARLCVNWCIGIPNEKIVAAPGSVLEAFVAFNAVTEQNKILSAALHRIASWGEGSEVTARFDEPEAAKIARQAIFDVGVIENGPS